MRGGWVARLLALAALALAACGESDDSGGAAACTDNSECAAPATCVELICQVACSTHAECAETEYCSLESGVCKTGCKADSQCSTDQVCRKGICLSASADLDGDGYPAATDCDDLNPQVNPGAAEICNGLDDNCNGKVDEALPPGDLADLQQGVCQNAHKVCGGKLGYVEPDYAALFPGYEATETSCDGIDNDCDGIADNGLVPPPADKAQGVCAGAVKHCGGASGWQEPDYSAIAGYEDYESGACDGIDSNCDGTADEAHDADGDGFYDGTDAQCASFYGPKGLIDCDDQQPKFGKSCIVHVDHSATGLGDGTSWANAVTNLQDALATAKKDYEIWVAAGTYRPDVGVGMTAGNRSASFQLATNSKIYGGFKGGETALAQRNFRVNLSILSGDLLGNDGPGFTNMQDNSYHIVKGAKGALLDGLWLRGGNANDGGGALHSSGPSVEITLANCTLVNNRASGDGGAIYLRWSSPPTLINTRFIANQAGGRGGAVYTDWSSVPNVYGSLFVGNVAGTNGGAISVTWFSEPGRIVNSTFANNSAPTGGAVYLASAYQIDNSVMFGNGSAPIAGSSVVVSYSSIEGGALGTGNTNLSASPFVDLDGADGIAGNADDDLHLAAGSSSIDSGNNSLVPSVLTLDLDGNPRIKGTVDRGAFEKP
jgi:parallel beta-helix repeat protein